MNDRPSPDVEWHPEAPATGYLIGQVVDQDLVTHEIDDHLRR